MRDGLAHERAASDAVAEIRLAFAGENANADSYLGPGWHGREATHRWMDGLCSIVRLPPLLPQPWFALTVQGFALDTRGSMPAPILILSLNGAELRRLRPAAGMPIAFAVSGDLMHADADNILVLDHPIAARPCDFMTDNGDTRLLSLAFQHLDVEPLGAPLALTPRLLESATPPDAAAEGEVAEAFQSLGRTCDVGIFQRHYGSEPFGLLRFANISPDLLTRGLRTRFAGVGDPERLSFYTLDHSRELRGRHAVYGLNYHTFKDADKTNVEGLAISEGRRLSYLARLFIEQLENNEKIFVRVEDFETPEEALALHLLLRAYHPRARLLLMQEAPAQMRERIGQVEELRPGLYRGYLSRMIDPARKPPRPLCEEWMPICTAVAAYERDLEPRDAHDGWAYRAREDALAGEAVDHVRLTFAGEDANAEPFLREGWHGPEATHRWMAGRRSVLHLPPLRAQARFVLTLRGWPLDLGGPVQTLTVSVNGAVSPRLRLLGGAPLAIPIAGDDVRADAGNTVVIDHREAARPCDLNPGKSDTRWLSLALVGLDLEPG